MHIHINHL